VMVQVFTFYQAVVMEGLELHGGLSPGFLVYG
jgi:hypothetical protein